VIKENEGGFWVYPKLLLVVAGCFGLTALLSRGLPSSLAVGLGFLPFFALLASIGHPITRRQLWLRIILLVLALVSLALIVSAVRTNLLW